MTDSAPRRYTLETHKEALKFSAAHVATFADGSVERLHGHNYQVGVRLTGELDRAGMVLDVGVLKRWTRALCDELDERVLVAERNPLIAVAEKSGAVELRYAEKRYVLPREDCVLLPLANTTMEHLAHYLAERLAERITAAVRAVEETPQRFAHLEVSVSETPGQLARWAIEL